MNPWHPCSHSHSLVGTGCVAHLISDGILSWTPLYVRTPDFLLNNADTPLKLLWSASSHSLVSRHHRWTAVCSVVRRACIGADARPCCVTWKNRAKAAETIRDRRGKSIALRHSNRQRMTRQLFRVLLHVLRHTCCGLWVWLHIVNVSVSVSHVMISNFNFATLLSIFSLHQAPSSKEPFLFFLFQ